MNSIVAIPRIDIDERLERENVFFEVFGGLSLDEWVNVLIQSIEQNIISGVEFPRFPPPELQDRIHGHSGAHSLREAADFYRFVYENNLSGIGSSSFSKGFFLDFGAGWGRITRLFMRDFPLRHIFGYEPSNRFCSVARSLNPFVNFVSGGYLPDGVLPSARFDLVVSWSVFSHLSPKCASAWLAELQRVTKPGGSIVFTTWGRRFLERLKSERQILEAGQEIHWYSKVCLSAIGNLDEKMAAYDDGKFVWVASGNSDLYGEAFLSPNALMEIIASSAPGLQLLKFDDRSLAQDVYILKKI